MRKRILSWLLEPILDKITYLYVTHLLNPRIRQLENTVELLWERKGTEQQEFVRFSEQLAADVQEAIEEIKAQGIDDPN